MNVLNKPFVFVVKTRIAVERLAPLVIWARSSKKWANTRLLLTDSPWLSTYCVNWAINEMKVALGNLGNVHQALGQHEKAVDCYERSVVLLRASGDRLSEGNAIGNLGTIYKVMGQHERAIDHYRRAIQVHREIGDRRAEGICLSNLGLYFLTQRETERAIQEMQLALEIHREVGDIRTEATTLGNLGDAFFSLNQNAKANIHYRQAIALADELYPLAAGVFRGSLAHLLAVEGNMTEAERLLEEGLEMVSTNPSELVKFLCKKGQVLCLTDRKNEASAVFKEANTLSQQLTVTEDSDIGQAIVALKREIEGI